MMADALPRVAGKLTPGAPLAPLVWFKSGGAAEWLFEPSDLADLQGFLRDLDPATPVMALGLGSNLIVRDGGVTGSPGSRLSIRSRSIAAAAPAVFWFPRPHETRGSPGSSSCARSPVRSAASCG
jgi:hypothetical protein